MSKRLKKEKRDLFSYVYLVAAISTIAATVVATIGVLLTLGSIKFAVESYYDDMCSNFFEKQQIHITQLASLRDELYINVTTIIPEFNENRDAYLVGSAFPMYRLYSEATSSVLREGVVLDTNARKHLYEVFDRVLQANLLLDSMYLRFNAVSDDEMYDFIRVNSEIFFKIIEDLSWRIPETILLTDEYIEDLALSPPPSTCNGHYFSFVNFLIGYFK